MNMCVCVCMVSTNVRSSIVRRLLMPGLLALVFREQFSDNLHCDGLCRRKIYHSNTAVCVRARVSIYTCLYHLNCKECIIPLAYRHSFATEQRA